MSKYDYGMELPEGGSIRWGYDAIPENSRVLEMGCAEGLLTRQLKLEKNCIVDVVEIDESAGKHAEEYARIALVGAEEGNLENNLWFEKLKDNRYDVITFLDVLEHLRNPQEVLKKSAELLTDNGYICVSVPNIGHNSVLINLLNDKFEYQDLGILDNTHIRFFCQETLEKMVNECGLIAVEKQYSRAQVGETIIDNDYNQINSGVANALKLRKNGEVFQFMYKLEPNNRGKVEDTSEYKSQWSTLYYDLGEGFSQENTIKEDVCIENHTIKSKFDTSHLSEVKAYRWDPIEIGGMVVMVETMKIISEKDDVSVVMQPDNAMYRTENGDIFITSDPSYSINGDIQDVKSIEIQGSFHAVEKIDIEYLGSEINKKDLIIQKADEEYGRAELEYRKTVEEYKKIVEQHKVTIADKEKIIHSYQEQIQQHIANEQVLHAEIGRLRQDLANVVHSYNIVINSTFWKISKPARIVLDAVKKILETKKYQLPESVVELLKDAGVAYDLETSYENLKLLNLKLTDSEKQHQRKEKLKPKVKYSIVVPLYNTPLEYLVEMIESVRMQTYRNWELCLADGSDEEHTIVEEICRAYVKKDKRIKYKKLTENLGISENTNAALEMVSGQYVALFDHDDLLHPAALYYYNNEVVNNKADFIYCDEITFMDELEKVTVMHFKPDFAIDNLRANNYICHFSVFSKKLLDSVGGFRKEFDGSQDYDLILRLTEKAQKISHISEVLYYWRAHANSVASDISAKRYTLDAAKKALGEHMMRCGLKAKIVDSKVLSWYRTQYEINGNPLISIIIPNKDSVDILKQCIESIETRTTYDNYEIIIVENNSQTTEIFEYYKELESHKKIKIVVWEHEFNYSKINNYGVKHSNGEMLVLLNNDIEVITAEWLEEMLMYTQRSDVGAAGAMLYYPNDTIQHAGVIIGIGGVAGHSHKYFAKGEYGYMGRLQYAQNLSAVTAACMMLKRSVYDEVEGLDEGFAVAFNDVDFCMRIRKAGYLICWTPFAELYHHESISRGYEDTPEKQARFKGEIDRFKARWGETLKLGDPYYNKNLTLDREDFSINDRR